MTLNIQLRSLTLNKINREIPAGPALPPMRKNVFQSDSFVTKQMIVRMAPMNSKDATYIQVSRNRALISDHSFRFQSNALFI